jgi:hypothetical protein
VKVQSTSGDVGIKIGRDLLVDDDALIYINGQLALDDQNGQATPFRVDVTPYLRSGENLIAIKAHDSFGFLEGIHLRVEVVYSEILPVQIDIKPGSYPNAINLSSAGVVPVAILSSSTFDATQVNPATVTLAGAGVKLIGKGDRYSCGREDVNGDGLIDLVCHVTTAQFFIEVGQSVAVLEAQTFSGRSIRGEDSIQIVP